MDMTNADVTFSFRYQFTGANKTIHAAGSILNALGYIFIDNTVYNKITNGAKGCRELLHQQLYIFSHHLYPS